jgi:Ca-activated chloride channel family protein
MRVHLLAAGICLGLLNGYIWAQTSPITHPLAPTPNASTDNVIKFETRVVSLTVNVTDKDGHPIVGLERAAFQVFEDNVPQEIGYFGYSDQPLTVGVVFDLSGSMGREKLQRAKEALSRLAQTCHARDDLALIGFNDRAWLVGDRLLSTEALNNAFGLLTGRGQTALYDAVALGLQQVAKGRQPRKALIIVSDGEDNRSRTNFKTIRRMALENDATIYAIGVQHFAPLHGYGKFILQELADLTGGKAYFPGDSAEMADAFDEIAVELRQQYSLGYMPANFQADGKLRRIKIKLADAGQQNKVSLRYRTGYVATDKAATDDIRADN